MLRFGSALRPDFAARSWVSARIAIIGLIASLVAGTCAAIAEPEGARARATAAAEANPAGIDTGAASTYSVLASTSVTNTGSTFIEGELGVSPGTVVSGFPPGVIAANGGLFHCADTSAANAQAATQAAYTDAKGRMPTARFPFIYDIGSSTFGPGVYQFPSSLGITGTVTLDGEGNPGSVFIFQAGSTLIGETYSKVVLVNGARAANVFWQVGTSATLKIGSIFVGTILAQDSITAQTNVSVKGRALALIGAVTLDTDTFGTAPAVVAPTSNQTATAAPIAPTPPVNQPAPEATSKAPFVAWVPQLPTLAYDPAASDSVALTPGEGFLAMTGGTITGVALGVLCLIAGWLLFLAGRRRRRREQEA